MSKIIRGYKFKIYPNDEQKEKINDLINFTRFVYNWGLAKEHEIFEQYNQGISKYGYYDYYDLEKLYRYERDNNPDMHWVSKFPLTTAKYTLRNLTNGFKMFFNKENPGKPKFKKKNKCKKSFNTRNDTFTIKNDKVKFEGIGDFIDLRFDTGLNFKKVINPAVTLDNLGDYYVSFSLEEEVKELDIHKSEPIGIDVGIRKTMTLSNGMVFNQSNKTLDRIRYRRKRKQKRVSRDIERRISEAKRTKTKYEDIPKSKRAIKRELDLKKSFIKEHNIKTTEYHTFAKRIVDMNPEYICMETFRVRKIQKHNRNVSSKLCQTSFYDLIEIMKRKCESRNIPFIQAPMTFASTKTCSNCGYKHDIKGKHMYVCPNCGLEIDRDINAAINLRNYGSQFIV